MCRANWSHCLNKFMEYERNPIITMQSDHPQKKVKTTRPWVLLADKIANKAITVGGVLVIGAVLGMMVFLVYEVAPLFKGGTVTYRNNYTIKNAASEPAIISLDEYKTIAAAVSQDGSIILWHAKTGYSLQPLSFDFGTKKATSFTWTIDRLNFAFGFSDGSVRLGRLKYDSEILKAEALPANLDKLDATDSSDGRYIYSVIPGNQYRKIGLSITLQEEIQISPDSRPIRALNYQVTDFGERPTSSIVAMDDAGSAISLMSESRLNLFTRKLTTKIEKTDLPKLPAGTHISFILVNDTGSNIFFGERSGRIFRVSREHSAQPTLVETIRITPDGVNLDAFGALYGDRSFVAGGSDGSVKIFFLLKRPDSKTPDGMTLVETRNFPSQYAGVNKFSPSQNGKTFATGDLNGSIWLRHAISLKTILQLDDYSPKASFKAIGIAPRMDGLIALDVNDKVSFWQFSSPHPETSLHTLLGKVWYEGYPEPSFTWQSTGATDAFEPKISLVPLIFGALKGTLYSLLFAVPLALMAAIYTSEFLSSGLRGKIKPVIEIMASIPSVVLGFVAALVMAPVVENWLAAVVLVFVVAPLCMVFCAYLWQLLPPQLSIRLEGLPKLIFIFCGVIGGIYAAYLLGPYFERFFFQGNFKAWLNKDSGSATPFLFLMLLPVMTLLCGYASSRFLGHKFRVFIRKMSMPFSALLDLARWIVLVLVIVVCSYAVALLLSSFGVDPRGNVVGTYVQRNTMIIAFAMGFAIIPIIYTLAEDALNSVPDQLRSASLGCGATIWQTAIWVILPTAISGVFSAVMIGMGRAVGETMIVVMATGNTPIIDLNIFNGLRALSANIAVELPEAPKDGSLYRVLFLTGLVLFAMTFVINTVAELVRQYFRKRSMQL